MQRSRNNSYIYLHMVFYTYKACWLIWTTSKFQDLPEPNSFSRTFQVLIILEKNSWLSRRRGNPGSDESDALAKTLQPAGALYKQ